MQDLCAWLEDQNGGVRTYIEFHKLAQGHARENRESAAILALLGRVAARFAARYEGEPLPVDEASNAIVAFRELVKKAAAMTTKSADERLDFANEIATLDIGRPEMLEPSMRH